MAESSQPSVRALIVGCGGMARTWIEIAHGAAEIEIVGLVDIARDQACAAAQRAGLDESLVYDDLETAIGATRPEAVFDVTVPGAHHGVTLTALRAGCHVLGEKPMSDRLEHAREMVAAADEAARLYAVTQSRRPVPGALAAAGFVQAGGVGRVEEVHGDFFLGPHFGGFRDEMAHPLLADMAIHTFDSMRQLTGAEPRRVYCHAFNPERSWYRGDASAAAVFEMVGPRGHPVVFTYRGSWCAEGLATSWNADWRIVGDQGTVRWDGEQRVRAEVVADAPGEGGFFRPTKSLDVGCEAMAEVGHAYLIREFARCVRTGERPMCPAEDNIKSLAMVAAAIESARVGQAVEVVW
ncbi:MAG: Gfo/Idh/MocA family oxidoreductase [Phycisphaeraceae bacterium]